MVDDRTAIADPLSYALASLSWSTWRAGVLKQHFPWGVRVADGHASIYVVRQGEAWLTSEHWDNPIPLRTGDIAIIPRGTGHCLRDAPTSELADDLDDFTRTIGQAAVNGNGQPEVTSVIYGYSLAYGSADNPLHANLSTLVRMHMDDYEQLRPLEGLFTLLEAEQRRRQPGWQAIAKQLVQVIFYQALRAFITGQDEQSAGNGATKQVVSDPAIGLVVGLLHSQPGDPWTVASLARWVHMSRSAFSERFREVVGQPPLHYLTELRMSRACHLLSGTDLGVKQIATLVGYESPSSFTNAFKRWHGVSPAAYRDHATAATVASSSA
jgi:AraC-like DNA-binding protein